MTKYGRVVVNMMYLNDLSVRFNLRLTQEQFDFLVELSGVYNVSPSALVRMFIDQYRVAYNSQKEREVDSHEDEQTFFDDKL